MYDLPDDDIGDEPCQENENFGFILHGATSESDNDVISLDRFDLEAATIDGNPLNIGIMGVEEDDESENDADTFIIDDETNLVWDNSESDDDDDWALAGNSLFFIFLSGQTLLLNVLKQDFHYI